MPKMIQLRHVPDKVHRTLKTRAAKKGMSLSDYLVQEVAAIAERPTTEELIARITRRERVHFRESVVESIRRGREER